MRRKAPSIRSGNSSHDRLEPKLLRAVEANSVPEVKDVLDQAQARSQCNDTFLSIGLVRACDRGLPDIARFLLSHGANPDFASGNKPPSLLRAAEYGLADVSKALIDFNANLEACDKKGRTALMTAAYKGHQQIVAVAGEHVVRAGVLAAEQCRHGVGCQLGQCGVGVIPVAGAVGNRRGLLFKHQGPGSLAFVLDCALLGAPRQGAFRNVDTVVLHDRAAGKLESDHGVVVIDNLVVHDVAKFARLRRLRATAGGPV